MNGVVETTCTPGRRGEGGFCGGSGRERYLLPSAYPREVAYFLAMVACDVVCWTLLSTTLMEAGSTPWA